MIIWFKIMDQHKHVAPLLVSSKQATLSYIANALIKYKYWTGLKN